MGKDHLQMEPLKKSAKAVQILKDTKLQELAQAKEEEAISHAFTFVKDIPQYLQVEIARTQINLRDILSWKSGSLVEFSKIVGEPLEVLIGDRLIARGEVVVVNNRYGIRISEITRPDEKPGDLPK